MLDNWWTNPIKDKAQIQYLITSLMKDETDEQEEITELRNAIVSLEQKMTLQINKFAA